MCNRFINRFTHHRISGWHSRLLLLIVIRRLLTAVWFRIIIQSIFFTDTICHCPEFKPCFFFSPQPFPIHKRNGIDNKVAVQMCCIQMCRNNDLKTVAPYFIGKLHPNLLCKFRGNILFFKTQVAMIGLNTICFLILLFDCYELITSGRYITVDTINIKFPFRFLLIFGITEDICQCLILFFRINISRSLFRIDGIVNDLFQIAFHRP